MMMTLFKKSIAQNTTQFPFAKKTFFLTKVITLSSYPKSLPVSSMPIDLKWKIKGKVVAFPLNSNENLRDFPFSFLRHSKM